jgi:hypothetical protein
MLRRQDTNRQFGNVAAVHNTRLLAADLAASLHQK